MINLLIKLMIIIMINLLFNLLFKFMSMLMIPLMAMLILVLVIIHSEPYNISILTDILTRHHSFTPSASPLTARHLQTAPAPTPSPGLSRLCR